MRKTSLADLPPELLDQIVAYVPTANCLSSLAQTSHALHNYISSNGWAIFCRARFPSTVPDYSSSWTTTARSLTTYSRAWDRRALVARFIGPSGKITSYPGAKSLDHWKQPAGQTVGFTPRIDTYTVEEDQSAAQATDVLAYSAGAQIVLREQVRHRSNGRRAKGATRWATYRPLSAVEGRDDVTALHLLPGAGSSGEQMLISGTANGDLQLLAVPFSEGDSSIKTYYATQGQAVQSSSITTTDEEKTLLAASLGHSKLALYQVDRERSKSCPVSELDTKTPTEAASNGYSKTHRVWSTQFLPQNRLAIGFGPSVEPLRVYEVLPSGLSSLPVRGFQLHDSQDSAHNAALAGAPVKALKSSVYPIVPVVGRKDLFFSGAYDGLVRLHDMRSPRAAELIVQDGYDDSAIYSLLLRGEETLIAGTSRHSHLKVFDARMNGRAYSYLDASSNSLHSDRPSDDFSLYLSTRASWHVSNRWRTDGSIYSLASTSSHSPFIYAGVQNGVIEIAATEILHPHPDPLYFEAWPNKHDRPSPWNGWGSKSVLNLARFEAGKMNGQKSMWDMSRAGHTSVGDQYLDARWKGVKSIDLD